MTVFASVIPVPVSVEINLHVIALDKNVFPQSITPDARLLCVRNAVGICILGLIFFWETAHKIQPTRGRRKEQREVYVKNP